MFYQDVRVGTPQSTLQRPAVKDNVAEGCGSVNQCRPHGSDKCPLHSKCIPDWEQYHCICDPGNGLFQEFVRSRKIDIDKEQ